MAGRSTISLGSMDATFALIMISLVLGPLLLVLGVVLLLWRRVRWFAAAIVGISAVAGALVAAVTQITPYTPWAVFWAGFTVIAVASSALSLTVGGFVAAIDRWEHRHAA